MARFALDGALRSHREIGLTKGTEWTFLALAYLRICAMVSSGKATEASLDVGEILADMGSPSKRTQGKSALIFPEMYNANEVQSPIMRLLAYA